MRKVYVVHANNHIFGVYSSKEKAKKVQKLQEINKGMSGYTDTRVYLEETVLQL